MIKHKIPCRRPLLAVIVTLLAAGSGLVAAESEKKPLKVVFLMGQSNMVGYPFELSMSGWLPNYSSPSTPTPFNSGRWPGWRPSSGLAGDCKHPSTG